MDSDRVDAAHKIFVLGDNGPLLTKGRDANDVIGSAWQSEIEWILIPVSRFSKDFFQLRNGFAGEFCQKFVNYGIRVAVVGDISHYEQASAALRDFVRESNRGVHLWFVASLAAFGERRRDMGVK